ncbi:flagellar export protein FliJ [Haloimpatiens sp. FM7315]|uniref:flagellar export protein FliJ n=1 Tax=Haloimpatiens sp. FM7315 TaxID=3298609 RepID=UPI003709CC88
MAKYKFKLQKLLDIRVDEEEKCKMEFKNIQSEKKLLEDKLCHLNENYKKYNFSTYSKNNVENIIRQNYLKLINSSIAQTQSLILDKDKEIEVKRKELKEKQVSKKVVEVLKDKDFDKYIKEQNMIEQKSNDEFALYGFMRNSLQRR